MKNAKKFEYYWRLDVWMLRLIGLNTMENVFTNGPGFPNFWGGMVPFICITMISIAGITQIVTFFRVLKDDLIYAMYTMITIGPTILCIIKGTQLWFYRTELQKLLQRLNELWENARQVNKIDEDIRNNVMRSERIRDYYIKIMGLTLISYCTRPYISLLKHQFKHHNSNESFDFSVMVYGSTYPFPINTLIVYLTCITYEQIVIFIMIVYWISCNTLFAQLTTHICIHFKLLANDIIDVTMNSMTEKNRSELLAAMVNKHNEIFIYCDLITRLYNPVALMTVVLNSLNFCSCIYCISKGISASNWGEVARDISHAISLGLQTSLYCAQGEWVTQQSMLVGHAVYHSHWMNCSRQSKMKLLMILIRAQNEVKVAAYGIIYLNTNQLTNMAKTAVSIFTLLRNFS